MMPPVLLGDIQCPWNTLLCAARQALECAGLGFLPTPLLRTVTQREG